MFHSVLGSGDAFTLKYIIMHVFLPLRLPDKNDHSLHNDNALAQAITTASCLYSEHIGQTDNHQWNGISRMLENLQAIAQSDHLDTARIISLLSSMNIGDVLVLPFRAQNVGVVFRKQAEATIYESFELSPKAFDVLATEGKLICSYPGPAIEIPNLVFHDDHFRSELANFLVHVNHDNPDFPQDEQPSESDPKDSNSDERRGYITELLTGILRGVGRPANITRISKRVGDDACNDGSGSPWRRSALWLLIRVALQTTLDRSPFGHHAYKEFMLFFMCCLATQKGCADLPSDLLQSISTKISRRLHKLGSSAPPWHSHTVLQICTSLRSVIEDQRRRVQTAEPLSLPWTSFPLGFNQDTRLTLPNSRRHLAISLANDRIGFADDHFQSKRHRRGDIDSFLSIDGIFFDEAYRDNPHVTLYDVERAVELGIDGWVGRVTDTDEACVKLEILADKYSSLALNTYAKNPELLSIMVLTTIELWVALDKIAIKVYPMLTDYSPEVPTSLLECLLLSKTASLHRLRGAHEYLHRRHVGSRSRWSVFSSMITANSFAIRYYRSSSHLQHLKTRIEKEARSKLRTKVGELRTRNFVVRQLEKIEAITHGDHGSLDLSQMGRYIWPLPADQLQAELVVFELDCPVAFNMWRTATLHLLVELCSLSVKAHDSPNIKLNDGPLKQYVVKHPRSRISIGSNARDPYRRLRIPAQPEEVCVENISTFFLFDEHTGFPLAEALPCSNVRKHSTYQLQGGPYNNLQKYVDYTSHTSNDVIANQADCHDDLPIHEYMAFTHLRSGGSLQWFNILRELRARSLNFRRPEVHALFAQAASQVGPLENAEWAWHQEIKLPAFCYALLRELEGLLQNVEANWMEGVTMDTISFLLRRLLMSSPNESISQKTLDLLRAVRGKAFSWVLELTDKLASTSGDEWLHGVLRDTAAICRGTYDVNPDMISKLLQSAEDMKVFLSTAFIIHEHIPDDVSLLPVYSQLLLDRNTRLSLAFEEAVRTGIQFPAGKQGIDRAVGMMWTDYHAGSQWNPLPDPNSRWLSSETAPPNGQRPQVVHFNLLDGSLSVDGRPLGRCLPDEFLQHPLYQLIFGNQKLVVVRSNLPGTNYSTRDLIFGHLVYFSLRIKDSELVIRTKRTSSTIDNAEIMELIPLDKLEGDFPSALLEGHAHWLNLSTSVMEIRPLDKLWESSFENWRVDCTPGQYRMWKGHAHLVDVQSRSWKVVSQLFLPLGTPKDLIITVSPTDPNQPNSPLRLCAVLPRYDLSFYIDEDGDIQCRNIRGMVYDENQFIGSLFGLVNKLVLRPKNKGVNVVGLIPRCIIIPEGNISYRRDDHHVQIKIALQGSTLNRVTYQIYSVNTELGCLVGNGSLTSKLYCAYLHALTSGLGADPLTGRSGTEEALSVLRSADCCSNMRLGPRDAELLGLIASICPSRTWNTTRTVQKVKWRALPANSQHPECYFLSKSIKERYQRLAQLFHESPSSVSFGNFPEQDDHLLNRSLRRATHSCLCEFPGRSFAKNVDHQYSDNLMELGLPGEHRACTAATSVYHRTVTCTKDIWSMVESWGDVSGDLYLQRDKPWIGIITKNMLRSWRGSTSSVSRGNAVLLRYDKSWLAPDLPSIWLNIYNILRNNGEEKWFQMLFSLPAMAYGSPDLSDLVAVFVAFASHPQFRFEDPPHYDAYLVRAGCYPSLDTLRQYVIDSAHPFKRRHKCLLRWKGDKHFSDPHQLAMCDEARNADPDAMAQELLRAWPCETPPPCSLLDPQLYTIANLESEIRDYFSTCFRNLKLKEHLTRVQTILDTLPSQTSSSDGIDFYSFRPSGGVPPPIPWQLDVGQLFTRSAPQLQAVHTLPRNDTEVENSSIPYSAPLHQLITTVKSNVANHFQHQYVSALYASAESFGKENLITHKRTGPSTANLTEHYTTCRASYDKVLDLLQRQLGPTSPSERALERSGHWPCFTPHPLFRFLASNSTIRLSGNWKRCLVTFALHALALQRARRLLLLHLDCLHDEFCKELENEGCDGWDAEACPDWLLIQLQGDFLIRRVQAEVANEMISPRPGGNTAMQLNMGEGKTSVIVPIVAAVLANGDQLVRIIVPKVLTAETSQLLVDRLGGLTNRRIYHVPFSRSLELDDGKVAFLRATMSECMLGRGILVAQPDHILSLKLASVEKQLLRSENDRAAHKWLKLQRWLHYCSRDILDEVDDILDVRSELIPTIGHQRRVEGSPERWTTIEQVLRLVGKHAFYLRDRFPSGVEYEPGPPGTFPHLRILQIDAGKELISWIVQDVLDCHVPNISLKNLRISPDLDDAIQSFISCEVVPPEKVQLVEKYFRKESQWSGLLLLRGLLAAGILLFAFKEKRWRVDYGLATTRTMLAVPYRAKDVPSQRAEFGHPDTAIILTYLSYYYHGLSEEQLKVSFEILLEKDDPSLTYSLWVRACSAVPQSLQTLSGINIKSEEQWDRLLRPLFSRNWATINFYLSNVVFPRTAVEFPSKLSSSGWDLAEKKVHLVTGFSGTNDGQHLFPVHITQHDPDHQRGTNAKVLSYVLQPENNHYMCINHEDGKRRTTREFLQILVAQRIHVLLDVGAQMLDLQNYELARAWLDITPLDDVSAAIYFNTEDELMVCTRDGSTQLLRESPFVQQIDRCLAYLDDAHTRGTNIKFPSGSRAAVTLGPRVTKDRLVQGCMRMRMLGHGHSISFFAPTEVDQGIRAVSGKMFAEEIETMDILHWTIRETWDNIQRWAPRWVQQGTDHSSRHAAWSSFCDGQLTPETLSTEWLQSEARTLKDLYGPRSSPSTLSFVSPDMCRRCIDLGVLSHSPIVLDEEQEREVEYEVGREQQVRQCSRASPANHMIHPDVVSFIKTGIIPAGTQSFATRIFIPVWDTLRATTAATSEAHVWNLSVLATTDFEKTVKVTKGIEDYMRPVHWIISAKRDDRDLLVVISPYEANCLLPDIKSSDKVQLHLYTPRVTKSMKSCDDVALYSISQVPDSRIISPSLMDRLNMFAGQLYLKDYETYIRLCHFLCVYARDLDKVEGIVTEPDGFILPKNRRPLKGTRTEITLAFANTPLVSLRALMNLRCKHIDYTSTHMGSLLHGRPLSKDDFSLI